MSFSRAFPYATDNTAIFTATRPQTDLVKLRSDGTWDAFTYETGAFDLELEVEPDVEKLSSCLPPGQSVSDYLEVAVILQGLHSRIRDQVGVFEPREQCVKVSLDPARMLGRVDLSVVVRLKRNLDPPEAGFAWRKGSRLCATEAASFWLSEPPKSVGDTLEIRWQDFAQDGTLVDEDLFALRLEDRPVILLNSAIPSAYEILSSRGTHGAAARIRDAIYGQLVHQAWSSILGHCLLEIARHDEADPPESVLDALDDWQSQVVLAWAQAFVPGESDPKAAAHALITEVRQSGSTVLIETLPEAIQARCGTISGFNGLISEFDRFQGGGS